MGKWKISITAYACACKKIFTDAILKDIESPKATLLATGIAYCNQLFDWEKKSKNQSPEDRKKQHLEK